MYFPENQKPTSKVPKKKKKPPTKSLVSKTVSDWKQRLQRIHEIWATRCFGFSVENVQIINIRYSNINLKTRWYLLKMNIFYTQQKENITCSSHLESSSQIILSWSGILAPRKSIAALSELHYHLSLYDCQFLDHWNKISKKECFFKASLFTLIYRHTPSKIFTVMTDPTSIFLVI